LKKRNVQKCPEKMDIYWKMETFGNIWKHLETQYIFQCELFLGIPILINMVTQKALKCIKKP
jgi:hypothetical protein